MSNIHTPNHDSVPDSNRGCVGCIEEAVAAERKRLADFVNDEDNHVGGVWGDYGARYRVHQPRPTGNSGVRSMTTERTPAEVVSDWAWRHKPGRWDDDHWEPCDPSHPDACCSECEDTFWPCDTAQVLAQLAEAQAQVAALAAAGRKFSEVADDHWHYCESDGATFPDAMQAFDGVLAALVPAATRYTEQAEQRGAEKAAAKLREWAAGYRRGTKIDVSFPADLEWAAARLLSDSEGAKG